MTTNKRARRDGTYTLEFAFVAIIFFMFLFAIFEYGRFLMVKQTLEHAAREGARYAVVHTYDKTTSDIINHVTQFLPGMGSQLNNLTIQVYLADPATGNNIGNWTDAAFGQSIAVQINGDYSPVLPQFLFMQSTIPVQARAMMISEAN
ncbi:MAG: hypothetical protein KatS3mg105_2100 [Gemmatales bacterium]|nr:MAG: hypothetical protein KatS3mg105_2100 [Gemmatales bacterium]